MNVLSLFDGMSCGQIALNRIGIKPNKYYAAEIDKYAIKACLAVYPNTIHLGSVTEWQAWDINWSSIDIVTGGFPCQAWSMAGKQLGDKDERGMLFWTMLDIMKECKKHNPKVKFLIENVKMKKEFEEYITYHTEQALGEVCKTLINSALVSAQNRNRYYWTNWYVEQPEDKGILLKDIIEANPLNASDWRGLNRNQTQTAVVERPATIVGRRINKKGVREDYNKQVPLTQCLQVKHSSDKSGCLTTIDKDNVMSTEQPGRYVDAYSGKYHYRKLTPRECGRLQTVPEEILDTLLSCGISNSQLYKMFGNGWTIDVIGHIFIQMESQIKSTKQFDLL